MPDLLRKPYACGVAMVALLSTLACTRRAPTESSPAASASAPSAAAAPPPPLAPILADQVAKLRQCKGDASDACIELFAHGRIGRVGSTDVRLLEPGRTKEVLVAVLQGRRHCPAPSWTIDIGPSRPLNACGITGVDLASECASASGPPEPEGALLDRLNHEKKRRAAPKKKPPLDPKRFAQIEELIQLTTETDGALVDRQLESTGLLHGCSRQGGYRLLAQRRTDELLAKVRAEAYECSEPEGLHDASIDSWRIVAAPQRVELTCSTASVDLEDEFRRAAP